MRKAVWGVALAAVVAIASPLLLSSDAIAQYRDFVGTVERISQQKLVVVNRKGDEMSFARNEATTVSGAKQGWGAIEKGDSVSVSWKMMDNPLVAYRVVVRPSKK